MSFPLLLIERYLIAQIFLLLGQDTNFCWKKLDISSIASPSGSTRGQTTNAIQIDNFNMLCDWFQKDCELYTIYEPFEQMKVLADNL